MELLLNPEILGAFIMLTMLEIVLGIDHIIFITVLTDRLPKTSTGPREVSRARTGDGFAHIAASFYRLDYEFDGHRPRSVRILSAYRFYINR